MAFQPLPHDLKNLQEVFFNGWLDGQATYAVENRLLGLSRP